ncbi:hypothetical protein SAMN05421664_1231 [Chryseobacterium soldanellicola]|uniref:Uncharacterized protein n=1 Tax=Chryseobacterium soldanellicola TaxID=311333 RepID=A0A1H1A410_9FLAO|nr:hypothetical protein [Chryseobacterium soldanellicola]SDQ34231.1 hypothetical protein SAMN05421664_1231 [Chryseobacterium soldanellicola]
MKYKSFSIIIKKIIYGVLFIVCLSKGQIMQNVFNNSQPNKLAQTALLTRIELTGLRDKAFLSLGTKIPIDEWNYVGVRGHFNWWDESSRKFFIIPELEYIRKITSYPMEAHRTIVTGIYASGGISPNFVSLKLGIVCYHFLSIEAGYNFNFKEHSHFQTKGFRFSIGINILDKYVNK